MFITNILLHLSHHLISDVLQSNNDRVPSCLVFDKKVLITAMPCSIYFIKQMQMLLFCSKVGS